MMNIKNIVFWLSGVIIGFIISIICFKNPEFLNIVKSIDWIGLSYWFAIFLGALIPITINYLLLKKQEVIKLKAKLAQDKQDVISSYKLFDAHMRSTTILNKKMEDLVFDYQPTAQDLSAPTLRGLIILLSHSNFDDWYIQNIAYIERLNSLGSEKISNFTFYMLNYLLNLQLLIKDIPDKDMWMVSVAVKNDFMEMSVEFNDILNRYLNVDLYKFKNIDDKKENSNDKKISKKLTNTDFMRYKDFIGKLKHNEIEIG